MTPHARGDHRVPGEADVPVPDRLRQAVGDEVRRCLAAEMGARGLLLTAPECTAATADAARGGVALLRRVLYLAYPEIAQDPHGAEVGFADDDTAARTGLALAFGAVTAVLLTPA